MTHMCYSSSLNKGQAHGTHEAYVSRLQDGSIDEMEKMEYSKRYDKWLTITYKIEAELKQVYAIYYGHCDEDMKASLIEDPSFDTINKKKDVIKLMKLLQSVNFNRNDSKELTHSEYVQGQV
jgi:hypothetical protein